MRKKACLEQIFGSRIRVRLLKLFLEHPDQRFYVREITRCTRSHIHSVRRELSNLCRVGVVQIYDDQSASNCKGNGLQRKFYEVNPSCVIFGELRSLLIKSQLFIQEEIAKQLQNIGSIRYLALTGFFTEQQGFPTDVIIVGRVSKDKCSRIFKGFEDEFGRAINYTIFPLREFIQRKEITDRFLYNFFETKKIVLIDRLPNSVRMGV